MDRRVEYPTGFYFSNAGSLQRPSDRHTRLYLHRDPHWFTKDTWVTAAEVRPSARSVVHHVIAVVRRPGSLWMKDAKPLVPYIPPKQSQDGEPDANDPGSEPVNASYELLAAYSPGMQPQRFDIDHSAKLIPAGSDIVLQVHYTPNGKTSLQDRTRVGITLAKEPPPKRFFSPWRTRRIGP
jgi:hypothetical protein